MSTKFLNSLPTFPNVLIDSSQLLLDPLYVHTSQSFSHSSVTTTTDVLSQCYNVWLNVLLPQQTCHHSVTMCGWMCYHHNRHVITVLQCVVECVITTTDGLSQCYNVQMNVLLPQQTGYHSVTMCGWMCYYHNRRVITVLQCADECVTTTTDVLSQCYNVQMNVLLPQQTCYHRVTMCGWMRHTHPSPYDLYCVGGTLSLTQSINQSWDIRGQRWRKRVQSWVLRHV